MEERKLQEIIGFIASQENMDKNPVSLLMEVAAQFRETVAFSYIDELGLSSQKLFTCEVKVGRLLPKCRGMGYNKRIAKANAAEQALELIKKRASDATGDVTSTMLPSCSVTRPAVSPTTLGSPSGATGAESPYASSNPVGDLQELCLKNNWNPPIYDLVSEAGESHQKLFIYECKVESWISQGQGRNKKAAKKLAAETMLSMVRGQDSFSSSSPGTQAGSPSRSPFRNFPDKWPKTPASTSSQSSSGFSRIRPTPSPVPFLSSFLYDDPSNMEELSFEDLTCSSRAAPKIAIKDDKEFCSSLRDKGDTMGLTVEYHDMREKGFSGNCQCFVRLNSDPPTVCCGTGTTRSLAHNQAAQQAILYLNTVLAV